MTKQGPCGGKPIRQIQRRSSVPDSVAPMGPGLMAASVDILPALSHQLISTASPVLQESTRLPVERWHAKMLHGSPVKRLWFQGHGTTKALAGVVSHRVLTHRSKKYARQEMSRWALMKLLGQDVIGTDPPPPKLY
mmetsp:Transcript_24282/g.38164  ORF Transcript_24282/g.38164 Transcript_24282/m.38164 type:complete len:136 (-) Transcript_24282:756-1163(-)